MRGKQVYVERMRTEQQRQTRQGQSLHGLTILSVRHVRSCLWVALEEEYGKK
jgi:hypothetical protein